MKLNEKALEAAYIEAASRNLGRDRDIEDNVTGIVSAYLSALVHANVSALVERLRSHDICNLPDWQGEEGQERQNDWCDTATLTATNAEIREQVERQETRLRDVQASADLRLERLIEANDRAEAAERAAVKVKPLEWPNQIKQGRRVTSSGGLITYTIAYYGGSEPNSGTVFRWAAEGCGWSEAFFAYEHAISEAQADYERRILSTLSPAESEPEQEAVK